MLPSCPRRARARRSRGGCTRRFSGPHRHPSGSSLLLPPVPAPRRAEELLGMAKAAPGWGCQHHTSHGLTSCPARSWPQAFISGHLKAELCPHRPQCLQECLGTRHSSPRPAPGSGFPPGEPRWCPSRHDPGRGGAWSSVNPGAGPRAKGRRSRGGLGALEEPPALHRARVWPRTQTSPPAPAPCELWGGSAPTTAPFLRHPFGVGLKDTNPLRRSRGWCNGGCGAQNPSPGAGCGAGGLSACCWPPPGVPRGATSPGG